MKTSTQLRSKTAAAAVPVTFMASLHGQLYS